MTADPQEMTVYGGSGVTSQSLRSGQNPVAMIPVSGLSVKGSPRLSGENPEHVRLLSLSSAELPPILVHYPTMRVIDGVHRLSAAKLRGEERIAATFFYGDESEAFVMAVRANSQHGLPLSLADRKSAAERIVRYYPSWSDRFIASVTGISAKTVAEIRVDSGGESSPGAVRIGRDGRIRPINAAEGRRIAAEMIAENPELSLRQIAKGAGISPETARDVRNKMTRGEDPVAHRRSENQAKPGPENERRRPQPRKRPGRTRKAELERRAGIQRLRSVPELSQSEAGRLLLRLLHAHAVEVEDWNRLGESVPSHWGDMVASLAFECGNVWDEFAQRIEEGLEKIA
ncbi:ParB N-terminal domain-containing protein [Streptomyces sp. NPDC059373]